MAKSKRRGRPTIGPVAKKAVLMARVEPVTRRLLAQAAAKHQPKLSVSRMAERLLQASLSRPTGAGRNRGLAQAIALLGQNIEAATGRSWQDDRFTQQTLLLAIVILIAKVGPEFKEGPAPIPPAINTDAAKWPGMADTLRNPNELGKLLAFNLVKEIDDASPAIIDEWTQPIFFSASQDNLALIARDLGFAYRKKGKSK